MYFLVIIGCAVPLSQMLGGAYVNGNITRSFLRLRLLAGISLEVLSIVIFGIYVGVLILLCLDPKKRLQGALLAGGTVLGLIGLQGQGLFLPNVDIVTNLPVLIVGLLIGITIGGGRKLLNIRQSRMLEFRSAARILSVLLTGFIIIGFLEQHIIYPQLLSVSSEQVQIGVEQQTSGISIEGDGLFVNAFVSVLFVGTIRRFMKYDAEQRFFILGPRGSGKSLFLTGTYLAANRRRNGDRNSRPRKPSRDLMEMVQAFDELENQWPIQATGQSELNELNFQFTKGSLLPKNMELESTDYAGEQLRRLPDALLGNMSENEVDNTLRRLREGVRQADTLVYIIDVERFTTDEQSLDMADYYDINAVRDNATVVIVATKADYLANEFDDETGLRARKDYREFKKYVNDRLRQSETINSLVNESGGTEIHPVYYETKENENGEVVPLRDETGSPMLVGFEEFLKEMERL